MNQDRIIDIFDINYVGSHWDTNPAAPVNVAGNTNGDDYVDIFDINALSSWWGQSNSLGGGGESAMMFTPFHVALAAYLNQIALVRQDKALLAWLDDNSAEELGQDIEEIGTDYLGQGNRAASDNARQLLRGLKQV